MGERAPWARANHALVPLGATVWSVTGRRAGVYKPLAIGVQRPPAFPVHFVSLHLKKTALTRDRRRNKTNFCDSLLLVLGVG